MTKPSGHGVTRLVVSGEQREKYGCIVTFSNDDCRWFPGRDSVKQAAEYADRKGLKVCTISTPETIFRDLQGTRHTTDPNASWRRRDILYFPEFHFLGVIGRTDLSQRRPRDPRKR